MDKKVLVNLSNTQRVVLEQVSIKNEDRVLFGKEYRRTTDDDWIPSKGITIPVDSIPRLTEMLYDIQNHEGMREDE